MALLRATNSPAGIPPLLLKNGGTDANMCSLNSNLQLLRHVPEYCEQIRSCENSSALVNVLNSIFSKCGSIEKSSALLLRQLLGQVANQHKFLTSAQQDTVELLDFLLDHSPQALFAFDTSLESRFFYNNHAFPCPDCKQWPKSVPGRDKILKVALPPSQNQVSLGSLLQRHFSIQYQSDGKKCSYCLDSNPNCPKIPYKEKFTISKLPPYLFVQIVRMGVQGSVK